MYIYIYIYIYACVYIYVCIHIFHAEYSKRVRYRCQLTKTSRAYWRGVCVYICIYIYMCVCVFIYVCVYICVCIYTCTYIYLTPSMPHGKTQVSIDKDFEGVVAGCIKQHGHSWLHQPLVRALLYPDVCALLYPALAYTRYDIRTHTCVYIIAYTHVCVYCCVYTL